MLGLVILGLVTATAVAVAILLAVEVATGLVLAIFRVCTGAARRRRSS